MSPIEFLFRCQECGTVLTLEQLDALIGELGSEAECPGCGSTDLDID